MSGARTDYYKILGVSRNATHEEIRKAYKKLSRKHHPDANHGDPSALEKFKQVQAAWDVLGDEQKRKKYDQYGSAEGPRVHATPEGQTWAWTPSDGGDTPFDMEELLEQFRAGGFDVGGTDSGPFRSRRAPWPMRGQDVHAQLEIPFQLAAEGGKYDLHLQRSGSTPAETLSVSIPAGIDTGSVIRLSGQGEPGMNGGAPGDLLVSIRVSPHPYFRREGSNLSLDVPVSVAEATLGSKVEIPTLRDGTVVLTIPPGSSSGTKLRLSEKSIVDRRTGRRGDQFAIVKIVVSKDLSDRARKLMTEFQQTMGESPRDDLWR